MAQSQGPRPPLMSFRVHTPAFKKLPAFFFGQVRPSLHGLCFQLQELSLNKMFLPPLTRVWLYFPWKKKQSRNGLRKRKDATFPAAEDVNVLKGQWQIPNHYVNGDCPEYKSSYTTTFHLKADYLKYQKWRHPLWQFKIMIKFVRYQVLWSECLYFKLPTPNSYVKILTPKGDCISRWAFGRCWHPECGALTMRLVP